MNGRRNGQLDLFVIVPVFISGMPFSHGLLTVALSRMAGHGPDRVDGQTDPPAAFAVSFG